MNALPSHFNISKAISPELRRRIKSRTEGFVEVVFKGPLVTLTGGEK